ncbi:MAG: hypothetical protein ACI835_004142 [Planctomycetota bacterium]
MASIRTPPSERRRASYRHQTDGQIAALDLGPVQIDKRPVVTQEAQQEQAVKRWIGYIELMPKISRLVSIALIAAKIDRRLFVSWSPSP